MRILLIIILLFSTSVSFAGKKDFLSDRWGKMIYYDEGTETETYKYIVDGKKKKIKFISTGESYMQSSTACPILGSRKFIEKKKQKKHL